MLNDVVHKPGSHEVLYTALRRHVDAMSGKNVAVALSSLAHLDAKVETEARGTKLPHGARHFAEPGSAPANVQPLGAGQLQVHLTPGAQAAERALAARLCLLLRTPGALEPRWLANAMWAVAKVLQREPFGQVVEPLSERLTEVAAELSGRDLATVLWSSAVLELHTKQALLRGLHAPLANMALSGKLSAQDLAQSLWAAAKLDAAKADGMAALALALVRASRGRVQEYKPHSVSVSMWALGLMDAIHGQPEVQELIRDLAAAAATVSPQMNPQMISNCAWGAARVGLRPGPFYDIIAAAATKQLVQRTASLSDQHVSNVVWAYAKVEVRSVPALQHMTKVGEEICRSRKTSAMLSHHIASIAWSFARAFIADQEVAGGELLPGPVRDAISLASAAALEGLNTWPPRMLAWVMWSVARASLQDQAAVLFPRVVRRFSELGPEEIGVQDFTMISWAISTVELCPDALPLDCLEVLSGHVLEKLRSGRSSDVNGSFLACIAWACAKSDYRGSAAQLVQEIAAQAGRATLSEAWTHRLQTMCAWSVVVQGVYSPSTAAFVRDVFARGVEAVKQHSTIAGTGEDVTVPHLDQLETIRVALLCEPGLRGLRLPSAAAVPCLPTSAFDVSESKMQSYVEEVLRDLGLGDCLQSEAVAETLSVDLLLQPGALEQLGPGRRWRR